jgi:hypothetical protein
MARAFNAGWCHWIPDQERPLLLSWLTLLFPAAPGSGSPGLAR